MLKRSVFLTLSAFVIGGGLGYYGFFDSFASGDIPEDSVRMHPLGTGIRTSKLQAFRVTEDKMSAIPSSSNLDGLLQRYSKLSPTEIRDELLRLCRIVGEDSCHKRIAVQYLAFKLGQQAPNEVKSIMENGKIDDLSVLFPSLMAGWAERDVMGAMKYLLEHKRAYSSSLEVFGCLVDVMVRKMPNEVIPWSDTLSKGERRKALKIMAESISMYHPEKMADFVSHIGSEAWKDHYLFGSIGKAWARVDWEAFETWVNTLDDGLKKEILWDGFSGVSGTDLKKATEKYQALTVEDKSGIASAIVAGMDKSEIRSGRFLDWLNNNLQDREGVHTILSSTLGFFENRTPELIQHLFEIPAGMVRDEALVYLVNSTVSMAKDGSGYMDRHSNHISPTFTDALDMASRISDPGDRDASIRGCWEYWMEKSPQEAPQWLEQKSALSSQDKQQLIQKMESRQKAQRDS